MNAEMRRGQPATATRSPAKVSGVAQLARGLAPSRGRREDAEAEEKEAEVVLAVCGRAEISRRCRLAPRPCRCVCVLFGPYRRLNILDLPLHSTNTAAIHPLSLLFSCLQLCSA
ncbi:predicted protein [Histoplasma capsulatum H143]|uniref:Uncharacterized protein n=1 Tax=Ajellomyces capsulatus (strain H143) TaxID=544712 RepID=C6HP57_AJECH|nr:predicted protein [Histoplasma capsulatum H143]